MSAPIDRPTETLRVQIGLTCKEIQIIHKLLEKRISTGAPATADLQSLWAKFAPLESPEITNE